MKKLKKVPSNGLERKVYEKRNKLIVLLKLNKSSTEHIRIIVNSLSQKEGWKLISKRTVQNVISDYLRSRKYVDLDKKRRDVFLSESAAMIEALKAYIDARDDEQDRPWAPFEYAYTIELLYKMEKDYLEMKGWNSDAREKESEQKLTEVQYSKPSKKPPEIEALLSELKAALKEQQRREQKRCRVI